MSKGNFKLIDLESHRAPDIDNAWAQEVLTEIAEMIDGGRAVTSVGVACTFSDGSVGTRYAGDSYVELLGALAVLKARVTREFD